MSKNSDEIDLIEIAKTIWNGKKLIVIVSSFFVLIGIVSALLSPILYTSSTTFIPSSQEISSGSNLSGVASLVGINLGAISSGSEIPASMYPQISESVEFIRLILDEFIDENKEIKMKSYLSDIIKLIIMQESLILINLSFLNLKTSCLIFYKTTLSQLVLTKKMVLLQFLLTCQKVNMQPTVQ